MAGTLELCDMLDCKCGMMWGFFLFQRGMPVKTIWPMVDDNGIFYCTRCSYKTEKKQNWYKHKQTHSGKL